MREPHRGFDDGEEGEGARIVLAGIKKDGGGERSPEVECLEAAVLILQMKVSGLLEALQCLFHLHFEYGCGDE
jgi:hypothetical protein